MIKIETIHGLDRVVVDPTIQSQNVVANYSFIENNGEVYLVANTITGDKAYVDDCTLPAGEYLNGHLIKSLEGQKIVIDEKHIDYGDNEDYDDLTAGTTLLKVKANGKLQIAATAPTSGVYFKITDKCKLTEKAVKAMVMVVDQDTTG